MIQYTWIGPKLMANTRSVVGEPYMGCFLMVDFNRLVLGGKEKWPLPPKIYGTVVLETKFVQICFQYLDSAPARNYDQSWDNLSDSIINGGYNQSVSVLIHVPNEFSDWNPTNGTFTHAKDREYPMKLALLVVSALHSPTEDLPPAIKRTDNIEPPLKKPLRWRLSQPFFGFWLHPCKALTCWCTLWSSNMDGNMTHWRCSYI